MSNDKGTEYVFIGPKGAEHYEFVLARGDVAKFQSMHKATKAMPLRLWEKTAYSCLANSHGGHDEPDWGKFDAFEIDAIDESGSCMDEYNLGDEDHWCVFGHFKPQFAKHEGARQDIADVKTYEEAMELARHFAYRQKFKRINPWTELETAA